MIRSISAANPLKTPLPWILLSALLGWAGAAAAECSLSPFKAHYQVTRNGKLLGESVASLERIDGDVFRYTVETQAEKGLAGFLGAEAVVWTEFSVRGTHWHPQRYESRHKVAFAKGRDTVEFDWAAGNAQGVDDKQPWTVDLTGGEIDPLLVNLFLMREVSSDADSLSYRMLEKGKVEDRIFLRLDDRTVTTPAGEFNTRGLARVHNNPKRRTLTWHSHQHQHLPVRVEQFKPDGEELVMALVSYESTPCSPVSPVAPD